MQSIFLNMYLSGLCNCEDRINLGLNIKQNVKAVVQAEKWDSGNCQRSTPGWSFPIYKAESLIHSNLRNRIIYVIKDQNLAEMG